MIDLEETNKELIENCDTFEDESDNTATEESEYNANFLDNYTPDSNKPSKKTIITACAIGIIIVAIIILCF